MTESGATGSIDDGSGLKVRLPPTGTALTVFISCFATAALACYMEPLTGSIIPLWAPAAIVLVAFLRSPTSRWPALFVLAMAADLAGRCLISGYAGSRFIPVFTGALHPLLIAACIKRFAYETNWFSSIRWALVFVVSTIVAISISTIIGVTSYVLIDNDVFEPEVLFLLWASTDALSLMIITPFLLCWTEPSLREKLSLRSICKIVLLTGIVFLATYFSFHTNYPLLFIVFPILFLITLRSGLVGATSGVVVVTITTFWITAEGNGPIAESPNLDLVGRLIVMQFYYLTAAVSTIPAALNIHLRKILLEKLSRQDAISNAALNNMVQGLCMFDDKFQLITCNQRYADLYHLPEPLTASGTPLRSILEQQVREGNYWGDPHEYVKICLTAADVANPHEEVELPDGRIIEIHRRELAGGAWVATHEDVTERRRAGHRIAYLASHDPLTDLPNRAFFQEQLQRSIALAERGHGFALHSLDLDRFKAVNDTFGHGAGDELLKQVGDRLRKTIREGDFVTRLGGDEFAILQFPLEKPDEAEILAARIVEILRQPYQVHGHEVVIGASVGTALAPSDAIDPAELLQRSDLALYRAKTDGRNTHCFFEVGMDTLLQTRLVLENELRTAVQKGEFELYYQPLLNLESGTISSIEALIRWRHPIRGLVESDDFLPTAEESGLIIPISEWVLRQACREAAEWPGNVKVAVNLSGTQFKSRNLVALVLSALKGSGLPPARLELEINEGVLLQETDNSLAMLKELRAIGVGTVMDDFGTGYSGLSYFRSFPFDGIKIDRSLIRDLTTREDSRAIIHATTQLSERLGMSVTAEGVETAEQLSILRDEGCTEIQGHYISRPLPARQVAKMLARYPPNPSHEDKRKAG